MEYNKMLDRLYMQLPQAEGSGERFEIPRLESYIQGHKTIVKQFSQAMKAVGRDEKQVLKFITKELGTAATINEGRLVLNGKFFPDQINKMFTNYVKIFVLCPECGKPDTKSKDQSGVKMLKCEACGAVSPIRK